MIMVSVSPLQSKRRQWRRRMVRPSLILRVRLRQRRTRQKVHPRVRG